MASRAWDLCESKSRPLGPWQPRVKSVSSSWNLKWGFLPSLPVIPTPWGPLHSLPHLTLTHSLTVKGMDRTPQQTPYKWLTQPHLLLHPLNRTGEYLPVSQWGWEGSVGWSMCRPLYIIPCTKKKNLSECCLSRFPAPPVVSLMGSPALMHNEQFRQDWQGWVMTMICSQSSIWMGGVRRRWLSAQRIQQKGEGVSNPLSKGDFPVSSVTHTFRDKEANIPFPLIQTHRQIRSQGFSNNLSKLHLRRPVSVPLRVSAYLLLCD